MPMVTGQCLCDFLAHVVLSLLSYFRLDDPRVDDENFPDGGTCRDFACNFGYIVGGT